jgi:threonine-phosphate decarboxylase
MHGGRLWAFARQQGLPPDAVLDASAGINPLGPPASVLAALQDLPGLLRHYPDDTQEDVRTVLARVFAVPRDSLWCGNGATEVMDQIVLAVRPRRTWVVEPAFSEYARIARRHGSVVKSLPCDADFGVPWTALDDHVQPGDLVIVNNPHNPSGRAWPRAVWEAPVRRWTAAGIQVMVDEAFMDFLVDADRYSAIQWAARIPGLWVVRSATKIFALPGLRFGFGVGHDTAVAALGNLRDPWSVNQLAQVAAAAAYQDADFLAATWQWLAQGRRWAVSTWGRHPHTRLHEGRANYLLVEFPTAEAATAVADGLLAQAILVRRLDAWPGLGPQFLRIALRTPTENRRIWEAASTMLAGMDRPCAKEADDTPSDG